MKREELLADAFRCSYWLDTAGQGDAFLTWDELSTESKIFWTNIARRTQERLARQNYFFIRIGE